MEHVLDYEADVVFLTETWQTTLNNPVTAAAKDYGFTLYHETRNHDTKVRGGGVGILCSNKLIVKKKIPKLGRFSSFEYAVYTIKTSDYQGIKCSVMLVPVYRDQYVNIDIFLDEFNQLLEWLYMFDSYLIISGDFNIHWGSSESDAIKFNDLLQMYNLQQHVTEPTNNHGNILDLVISPVTMCSYSRRSAYPTVSNVSVNNVHLSNHYLVSFSVDHISPVSKTKVVYHRHFRSIDQTAFKNDLMNMMQIIDSNTSFKHRVSLLDSSLLEILDVHAPLHKKHVKNVTGASWFNNEYDQLRRQRRNAERKAKKSRLTVDIENFKRLRKETTLLSKSLKKNNIRNSIESAAGDQKQLYRVFHSLVDNTSEIILPDHASDDDLAERFSIFFTQKVKNIHQSFVPSTIEEEGQVRFFPGMPLTHFKPVTVSDIKEIIEEHGIKCSLADHLNQQLYKENLDIFLPLWTKLVNASLEEGSMDGLKMAYVKPLIKGGGLDQNELKNYRPVSNLPFLSKIIERVVLKQLNDHLKNNNLVIDNQSGYKKGHSTETLLIKITNDLLIASDKNTASVLLLLDLSAAFDTVNIDKLLNILFAEIGISGKALLWFRSFLVGRRQKVKIGNSFSNEIVIEFGVPQGSVLGPVLFNIYIRSFYRFIGLNSNWVVQGFADDHQLYTAFSTDDQVFMLGDNIRSVMSKIKSWMDSFFLKLNESKTKVIVFASPRIRKCLGINGVFLENTCVRFPNVVENLGVMLDTELTFKNQVLKCAQSCFEIIRKISKIRVFLSISERKILVTSLVLSQLDYCNGLYYNINNSLLNKLQSVQNCAAKLIYNKRKFDKGLGDMFVSLHWLKVKERIVFKVLLLVHKCVYGESAVYLNEMLMPSYSFLRTGKLINVRTNFVNTIGAFSVCAPKLWNNIPHELRFETSNVTFKRKLKHFLFNYSQSYFQSL